jgi:EAL domain-containing protein (putative c-di-GMP-specific phosphodiesterase class I)
MSLVDRKIILETFSFINDNDEFDNSNTHYSINLSGNSLSDKDFVGHILEQAERFDINTRRICFEITETAAIKNLHHVKTLIKELKAAGFQFALDDFGSGLSSFHYLKNLHVDYLKIDGSFVADMVNNNIDRAMVAAISEVGHVMGIKTIAEYVENDQIIKKLQDIDVDFAQGYGIEQPKPLQDLFPQSKKKGSPTLKVIHNKPRGT